MTTTRPPPTMLLIQNGLPPRRAHQAPNPLSGAMAVTSWQAFREGWEAHKRPVSPPNQSRRDFYCWSPPDATWAPYTPRLYTVSQNLTGPSVNVSNVWSDVRDLFITVTDQHHLWSLRGQPDVKWDPQTGAWVRANGFFEGSSDADETFKETVERVFHHPTASEELRHVALDAADGNNTGDRTARRITDILRRYCL